jgi:hypothetical protein
MGEIVRQVKIFAKYSIPLLWGMVGLVVGCVGAYFALAFIWPTVMILSLISGVFIGSASLYASAQTRWQGARRQS